MVPLSSRDHDLGARLPKALCAWASWRADWASTRTVTPTVHALEGDGLLRRVRDQDDRRAHVLSLTPAGMRVMHRAHDVRAALAARIFAPLGTAERTALARALDTILAAAGEAGPAYGQPARET